MSDELICGLIAVAVIAACLSSIGWAIYNNKGNPFDLEAEEEGK